jgi:hypothetical protein
LHDTYTKMANKSFEDLAAVLKKAIAEGAPLYNGGDIQGCADLYLKAAKEAVSLLPSKKLEDAITEAENTKDAKEAAWVMRGCFDSLLVASSSSETNENLSDLLKRTINQGAPLYNNGDKQGCYELYMESAKYACEQEQLARSAVGQLLEQATDEAMPLGEAGNFGEAAWVLRHCFDEILAQSQSKSRYSLNNHTGTGDMSDNAMSFRGAVLRSTDDTSDDGGYWQDEKTENTSDFEIGTSLSDFAFILRATIRPTTHKRFTGKSYADTFQGSEAVEVLTGLGLAKNRKAAVMKCTMLLGGSFLIPVSHETETSFSDGTHLYRFPDRQELQEAHDKLIQKAPLDGQHPDGSLQAQLVIALENTLELPVADQSEHDGADSGSTFSGVSTKHLQPRRLSALSPDQARGISLAHFAIKAERVIDIQDRTHHLKKYEKCFVGTEAVSKLVDLNIVASKEMAVKMMKELNEVGLIHHVLYDHGFEDSHLFYRFTSSGDLRRSLDALAILPSAPTGQELVRQQAVQTRYQQFADLDVASILNSFFGCDNEEGWDLVDLQNWRNNMKRWGFGRREDQDDEMVEKLSPLALNVDPETWYENLTDEEREKWESPWGIFAQIAIFDQVPR